MRNILSTKSFIEGDYSTDFISETWPDGYANNVDDEKLIKYYNFNWSIY